MAYTHTRTIAISALIAALMAASALVSIPVGPVPVTLQVMVVVLAALVLQPSGAFAAMAAYVLLGAIGLPVFAGAQGGLGVLAGPTGGFLLGFVLGAPLGAWARTVAETRLKAPGADVLAAACVIVSAYAAGWPQLALVTGMSAAKAFAAGVAPFVLWDAIKAAAAIGFAISLRKTGALRPF